MKTPQAAQNVDVRNGTTRTELRNALRLDRNTLDQATLKTLMTYDPETGEFRWKAQGTWRHGKGGAYGRRAGQWNGSCHVIIYIGGIGYGAHRLAWLYVYGKWPEKHIDHIDRNPDNNRILNLREVTQQQNTWNTALRRNNTSGYKGVFWEKQSKKWSAVLKKGNELAYIGRFDNLLDAARAYDVYVLRERGEYAFTNFDPIEYL